MKSYPSLFSLGHYESGLSPDVRGKKLTSLNKVAGRTPGKELARCYPARFHGLLAHEQTSFHAVEYGGRFNSGRDATGAFGAGSHGNELETSQAGRGRVS